MLQIVLIGIPIKNLLHKKKRFINKKITYLSYGESFERWKFVGYINILKIFYSWANIMHNII